MFLQGRVIIIWLTWLIGGICGVVILLLVVCYCRLMPRHQKSFDEQYLKENYAIKENQAYTSQENYRLMKHAEMQMSRQCRPASYAGDRDREAELRAHRPHHAPHARSASTRDHAPAAPAPAPAAQYASSGMLDEIESMGNIDALKTRSLPAFLRPKPRPLSTEDDLQQLYAKVSLSKKHKNRMRSEHAAIIALSKSHSQFLDAGGGGGGGGGDLHTYADAVIVYDQRTAL